MILYCDGMRQTLEWDRYYPLSPQRIEDKYWTSAGWNWTKGTFPLPGTQRGETLCNRPLAQHCAEEEEDGSSSPDVTSAICLPSWSQTLFSARTSAVSFNSSFSTVFVLGELNELQNTALQLAGSISACQIFTPALFVAVFPQIISVTGFMDADRDDLKLMAYLAGARYTGYLCRSNTVLICKE